MKLRGKVRGSHIHLDSDPGLPDGTSVVVEVALTPERGRIDGLTELAGSLPGAEWDEIVRRIYRDRTVEPETVNLG